MNKRGLFKIGWKKGFNTLISPRNSELETLTIASLSLNKNEQYTISFPNEEFLMAIIKGESRINNKEILKKEDMIFCGPNTSIKVSSINSELHAIIAHAVSSIKPTIKIIRIKDILKSPMLYKKVGTGNYERDVVTMVGDNIKAARLLAGYTWVKEGNWSSWPPHEHGEKMEEVYIFYELPKPGFGLQLVFENYEKMRIYFVRENDTIVIPRGYHPNVVTPSSRMKYLWIISARREFKDRVYGAWNVHPDFK